MKVLTVSLGVAALCLMSAHLVAEEMPHVSAPAESVDPLIERFFLHIDKAIADLTKRYPQLSDWEVTSTLSPDDWRKGPREWSDGKRVDLANRRLFYSHAIAYSSSPDYRDSFQSNGCTFDVLVYTENEWFTIEGPGIKTQIFGLPMQRYYVVAGIRTEKPEVPGLEQAVAEVVRQAAAAAVRGTE